MFNGLLLERWSMLLLNVGIYGCNSNTDYYDLLWLTVTVF